MIAPHSPDTMAALATQGGRLFDAVALYMYEAPPPAPKKTRNYMCYPKENGEYVVCYEKKGEGRGSGGIDGSSGTEVRVGTELPVMFDSLTLSYKLRTMVLVKKNETD